MTDRVIHYYMMPASPWCYLGSPQLEALARRYRVKVVVKPVALEQIFRVSGALPLSERPAQRRAYRLVELARWRDYLALPLELEPAHFPVDTALAARVLLACQALGGDDLALAFALGQAVWAEQRDIADSATLAAIVDEQRDRLWPSASAAVAAAGDDPAAADGTPVEGKALVQEAEKRLYWQRYQNNTDEAIAVDVFGVPSYLYRKELFWGQDRLGFLERVLAAEQATTI